MFDQRGIGLSQALSCHAFERPDLFRSIGPLIEACAAQLGPTRSLYTTADTVADIEAIRRAGGYEKLLLYGTSYGTKVAEEYAQTYPEHVEGLVLDSVVTPTGPDPLDRSTFAAIPRVLRALCARRQCVGITHEPVADLARVLARTHRAPLSGRAINGEGRAHRVRVTSEALFGLLLAGDFSPALRAQFVTAVRAAATGDSAPIARLLATAGSSEGSQEDFDSPLYYATTCEEQAFPWSRSATPARRLAEARAAAAALPASVFAPFDASTAIETSDVPACAGWPYSSPAPAPATAPLPSVPTLILSGAEDLRTPTSEARAVAAEIAGSHLLVVPDTGHSVLGEEPTACGKDALQALFAGGTVRPCAAEPTPAALRPPPLPPARLALVPPRRGYSGRSGRTLEAIALSLADLGRQLALQLGLSSSESLAGLLASLRTGGLRAGWAQYAGSSLTLHGYSYVPGVSISGSIAAGRASLTVAGSAAAHGSLGLGAHGALVGVLEGRRVNLPANAVASAAIVAGNVEASSPSGYVGPARRYVARELAGLLPGLLEP